jgi:hypothetical protein
VTVRNGSIVSARRNVQMIEVHWFGCGNISGHGDLCGSQFSDQCEQWGSHALRKSCPVVYHPNAEARAAVPYIQGATVHTAGPPTIVRKSAGDPVGGTVRQP